MTNGTDDRVRCAWASHVPEFGPYHDTEWGFPVTDDTRLFEKTCLESFQSGLSWRTILNKREAFRRAFAGFDPDLMAHYGDAEVAKLLQDASIVRHRGKIEAVINNARVLGNIRDQYGSFASFVWRYEPDPRPGPRDPSAAPIAKTKESAALAKDLKGLGWKFFGPTTAYAFMQAMGLVNDHTADCWCYPVAEAMRKDLVIP